MTSLSDIARTGTGTSEALRLLREAGASPVQAIMALRDGRGLPIAKGKTALMRSPAWVVESEATARLHDELIEALEAGS